MAVPNEERLVFNQAVEGLFHKALKDKVTDKLRQRLLNEAKVDLSKPLEPAMKITTWNKCVELCAQEMFPELPLELAIERIGYLLTKGYFQTFIGSALASLLRVIGPARGLKRMDRSLRTGNNYAEIEVTQLGPGRFKIWCNELGTLRYNILGLLLAGAEVCGAKNARGLITHFDDRGVTIEISWDE